MLRTDLYAQRLGLRPSWRGGDNHGSIVRERGGVRGHPMCHELLLSRLEREAGSGRSFNRCARESAKCRGRGDDLI